MGKLEDIMLIYGVYWNVRMTCIVLWFLITTIVRHWNFILDTDIISDVCAWALLDRVLVLILRLRQKKNN